VLVGALLWDGGKPELGEMAIRWWQLIWPGLFSWLWGWWDGSVGLGAAPLHVSGGETAAIFHLFELQDRFWCAVWEIAVEKNQKI
jgi:hypothetical protein